jgi:hypothetical protein
MNLWKKFYNAILSGSSTIPKNSTLTADAGSTVTLAGTANMSGTFQIGGTTVSATAAELNASVAGLTATAAEINRTTDISGRVVTTTATTLSLTVAAHGDRVVLVNTNSTVANTLSLPAAAGTGVKFTVINGIAQTQGSIVVAANGTDIIKGMAMMANSSTTVNAIFALTSATSDKVTLNRTTTGGAGPGDFVEVWDVAANTWSVRVGAASVGNATTPFSET